MTANAQTNLSNNQRSGKWFNSPVMVYKGITTGMGEYLPDFERRCFNLPMPDANFTCINPNLDMIVRKPYHDSHYAPIAVVSKDYKLVPHREVFEVAVKAMENNGIDPSETQSELALSEYGERMNLCIFLPEQYDFDPGDGEKLAMRLELFNSVDGSSKFKVFIGWFRFVCSNGMILGIKKSTFQRRHQAGLSIDDIGAVLESGLRNSKDEKEQFKTWRARDVRPNGIVRWINEDIRKIWGFKAATRAYHIARSGYDVKITGPYKDEKPTTIPVKQGDRVPGTPDRIANAYDVSQVLAWLAKERKDIQEQLQWREQIPELMKRLPY